MIPFYRLSVWAKRSFALGLLFFSLQFVQASTCAEQIRHVDFKTLEQQVAASVQRGVVEAPFWLQAALPEGFEFIARPLEQAPTGRVSKEMGSFVGVRAVLEIDGQTYVTNVGLSPRALADNIKRHQEGKKKLVTPENARGAGVFSHGGGTNLSSFANAATAAVQMMKRFFSVVSFDWFGHGANRQNNPTDPSVQYRLVPEFMKRYFPDNIDLVPMGHSYGGQINDVMMSRLTPAYLDNHYHGMRLRGFVMLSPPADRTMGGSLFLKVKSDTEFTDEGIQGVLFDKNNLNLRAQKGMTDMAFLQTWNDEMLNRAHLPGFYGMGKMDDVCYIGCEKAHQMYMLAREGVESHLYDRVVDAKGDEIAADHMIPKFMRDKNTYDVDPKSMGADMPWVYADLLKWFEVEILGNKDFDPFDSTKSEDLTVPAQKREEVVAKERGVSIEQVRRENAEANYQQQLSTVLELYSKNLVFREFLKNFKFKGRKPVDHTKLVQYNDFLGALEALSSEVQVYARHLKNEKIPFAHAQEWNSFFAWMKQSPEQRFADRSIDALVAKWASGEATPAQTFAAEFIRYARGEGGFETVRSLLDSLPISIESILQNLESPLGIAETVAKLDSQKRLLVGIRDVDMDALAALNPDLKQAQKALSDLTDRHSKLVDLRKKELLPRLIVLYAQLVQTQRLFVKYSDGRLSKLGKEFATQLDALKPLDADLDYFQILEAFPSLQQVRWDAFESDPKMYPNPKGWQTFAFESLGGPEMRTQFSILDKMIKDQGPKLAAHKKELVEYQAAKEKFESELNTLRADPSKNQKFVDKFEQEGRANLEKREKKLSDFQAPILAAWKSLAAEFEDVRSQMSGTLEVSPEAKARIQAAEAVLAQKRKNALSILKEFFEFREKFIEENESLWTETSRPEYPKKYDDLIDQYEAAQEDFQRFRHEFETEKRDMALAGELGAYYQMLYKNLDYLDHSIVKLSGKDQHDEGSLAAIEFQIQSIEHQIEDAQADLVQNYVPSLYQVTTLSGWDVLNDPNSTPSSSDLNRLLQAWNRIWRDPTGGQVQDTSQY